MRSRKGFFKKLLLSGATAISLVGFASPAVFAWDGSGGSNYNANYNYNYNVNYNANYNSNYGHSYYNPCDNDWDWNSSSYCMPRHYIRYSSYNNYYPCDHHYQTVW